MKSSRYLLAAMLLLPLLESRLVAQPSRGRSGSDRTSFRRGGFGRSGFGDGMLSLLRHPEVQQELQLERGQAELIAALQIDMRDQMGAMLTWARDERDGRRQPVQPGIPNGGPQDDEVENDDDEPSLLASQSMREKTDTVNRNGEQILAAILEWQQYQRLDEIRLQSEGVRAFLREEFTTPLGLTGEQRAAIIAIVDTELPPAAEADANKRRDQQLADVTSLLTAEQRIQWEKLKGAAFKLPERRGRFGGRSSRSR